MQKKISLCGTYVHPGETANLALTLPEQYSCAPLYMPIKVIHGKKEGPCLVVLSALSGTELNGLEITNRLVESLSASSLTGTLIAIPVVNIYGLTRYPFSLAATSHPSKGDLSHSFPGNEEGSYGERVAHLITEEILKKTDYCIELQTGGFNHNILPQVYCNFKDQKAKDLAKLFSTPVITNVPLKGNKLRQTTEALDIPLLVYQAGEAMRFDEGAINVGLSGLKNSMRSIGMLEEPAEQTISPIFSKDEDWIAAHKAGILHPKVTLGQAIEKGEVIGDISDPFGADLIEPIPSTHKGIVVGVNTSPLIHEGMKIFKIAAFWDDEKAETAIDSWEKAHQNTFRDPQ